MSANATDSARERKRHGFGAWTRVAITACMHSSWRSSTLWSRLEGNGNTQASRPRLTTPLVLMCGLEDLAERSDPRVPGGHREDGVIGRFQSDRGEIQAQ